MLQKIRITGAPDKEVDDLFKQQKHLKTKEDVESKRKLKDIEEKLADKLAEDMFEIVKKRSE